MNSAVLRRTAKELKDLALNPLEGISVSANEGDLTDITVTIDGPEDTPFAGGVFKVKLRLGSDFPSAPPKGYFITKVFHPNVAPSTGEICVNTLKKDWKDSYGLSHILLTIKCLLIVPNPESALNEDAGRLLLEAYDDYFQRARTYTAIHAIHKDRDLKEEKKEENVMGGEEKEEKKEEKALGEAHPNSAASENKPKPAIVPSKQMAKTMQATQAKRGLKRL